VALPRVAQLVRRLDARALPVEIAGEAKLEQACALAGSFDASTGREVGVDATSA